MDSRIYDATALLNEATAKHRMHLSILIAETGLWASPLVHRHLSAENGHGVFFPGMRRCRASRGEKRGDVIEGIYLDDNSYANHAIKRAIGVPRERLIGFEACHIWPQSCYDARYHTAIANLVLLPRAIAGLSDHDPEVRATLQYRSFALYDGWYPAGETRPAEPPFYPRCWREPFPFSPGVINALARRRRPTA